MIARFTSVLMIAAMGSILTLVPASGFAGSAQDAFKKLQAQSGSNIKGGSSSSSSQTSEKAEGAKVKTKKAIKGLLDKASKKHGN